METTLTRPKPLAAGADPSIALSPNAAAGITRGEFDEIVLAHQRRIYRVLLGLVRDTDAAGTLTQECFFRAYRNLKSFRGQSSIGTWLVRIAVNLAIDHARSRRNSFLRRMFGGSNREDVAATAEALPDPAASPEQQLGAREELQAVWSAVDQLPPRQRAVFLLRFAEEMTLEEIAQAMTLEVGTVKAHLSRALTAVRKRLKETGYHARTSEQ